MKNVSFPALVNLQMEFSVIGAFTLIIEGTFSFSLDATNFTKHNSTTSSSLNQFNKGFVSLNLWDSQVAALSVRFVLIHVVDILIVFLFVCLFVGASVDVFYEWPHRTSEILFNARREKSPSSHVMLCLLHKTPMKCQTISLEYIFEDFGETIRTEARFIM